MTMPASALVPAFPPSTPIHSHVLIEPGEWQQLEVVASDSGYREYPSIVTALRQNCNLPISLAEHGISAEVTEKFNRLLEEELSIRLLPAAGMEGHVCFQRVVPVKRTPVDFKCHA